jgi:transcription initiation factor TFIIIB Brf1 subunit/transcription initiation factor TFIIB
MSAGDVTEITCGGCNAGHDWYCAGCWNGIMGQLRDADIERHALRAEVEDARVALGDAWQNDEIAKGIVRKCAWSKEDSEIQREAAKWREKLAVSQLEEVRARVTELEQLLESRWQQ